MEWFKAGAEPTTGLSNCDGVLDIPGSLDGEWAACIPLIKDGEWGHIMLPGWVW